MTAAIAFGVTLIFFFAVWLYLMDANCLLRERPALPHGKALLWLSMLDDPRRRRLGGRR